MYNAMNQRVETVTSTATRRFLFHPSGKRAATLDGSGTVITNQAYLGSQPVVFLKAGSFHYQHQDWLGTEWVRTSASGTVENSFTSLPLGGYYFAAGSDQDPSHYTGLDQDAETGTAMASRLGLCGGSETEIPARFRTRGGPQPANGKRHFCCQENDEKLTFPRWTTAAIMG
jgi:hypothetical protein